MAQPGHLLACPPADLGECAGRKEGRGLFSSVACSPGIVVISLSACLDRGFLAEQWVREKGSRSWAGPGVSKSGGWLEGLGVWRPGWRLQLPPPTPFSF